MSGSLGRAACAKSFIPAGTPRSLGHIEIESDELMLFEGEIKFEMDLHMEK